MNKKHISLLLAFAMVLCLMPAAAMAADAPSWVTIALPEGTYSYDDGAKTLTITSDAHMTATLAVSQTLTLDLNGHTLHGAASVKEAVAVANGATLRVKSTGGAGIILGADDYNGTAGQDAVHAEDSCGIVISANVTVQGGNGSSYHGGYGAFSRKGNITIEKGGTAIGGNSSGITCQGGYGAHSDEGNVTVSGTATGGNAFGAGGTGGTGAHSKDSSITVNEGGKATGGSGRNGGHGAHCGDNITVHGTATGGDATGEGGYGAYSTSGSITVYGTAAGGNASGTNGTGGTGAVLSGSNAESITIYKGGKVIGGNASGAGGRGGNGAYSKNGNTTKTEDGKAIGGNATGANGTGGIGAFSRDSSITVNEGGKAIGGEATGAGGNGTESYKGSITINEGGTAKGGNSTGKGGIGAYIKSTGSITINEDGKAIGGNSENSPGEGAVKNGTFMTGDGIEKGSAQAGEISVPAEMGFTYGDAGKKIDVSITKGNEKISYKVGNGSDVVAVSSDGMLTIQKAGTAKVTVRTERTDEYSAAEAVVKVEVKRKALRITADSLGILNREAIPEFTATVEGLVSGETISGIQFDNGGAAAGVAGSYTITPSGGTISRNGTAVTDGLNNYAVDYVSGTLTITAVDVSSLNAAIKAANEAKNGIVADDRPREQVENGKKFVTTAEMQALSDAIASATAAIAAVNNKAEAEAAAELLHKAVAAFQAAIKTGSYTPAPTPAPSGDDSDGGSNSGSNDGGGYTAPAQNSAQNESADIRLSGIKLPNGEKLVTVPAQSKALMKMLGKNKLVGIWDISLKSGKTSIEGSTLSFSVGRENAGKMFTLYHEKADGTVESFSAKAEKQGIVSFYPIHSLSPFMLVEGGGITTTSVVAVPATGDRNVGLGLLLLSAMMAAAVMMKRRKAQA